MKLSKIIIILVLILTSGVVHAAERLSMKDYDKLIDLGYNKLDAVSYTHLTLPTIYSV